MNQQATGKILDKYFTQLGKVAEITLPATFPVYGQEVAPRYKAVPVGDGTVVWYDDDPHMYFRQYPNGIRMPMVSVTTIIHAYSAPFDVEAKSLNCAYKNDYDCKCLDKTGWEVIDIYERQRRIKQAWRQNNRNATGYGTFAHAVMEGSVVLPHISVLEMYRIQSERYNLDYPVVMDFARTFINEVLREDLEKGYTVLAEPLIFDIDAMIAGQSDIVVLDTVNRIIYIKDFKTNERKPGTERVFNKMTGSLRMLDDVSLTHYCIQLCLYQRMVQNILPTYSLGMNTILWLNRETGMIEPVWVDPNQWAPVVDTILMELRSVKNYIYELYKIDQLVT